MQFAPSSLYVRTDFGPILVSLCPETSWIVVPVVCLSKLTSARKMPVDVGQSLRQVHAAIDVEDVAGDVGGFVAGEENDGGGDILAGAHAAERNAHFQFFFYVVGKEGCHGRLDETRRHGVDRDVARRDFYGDGLCEADEAGFGRDVIGLPGVAAFGDDGRDVDDAAGAGFHHRRQHLLDADVRASKIGADDRVPVVGLHAHGQAVAGDGGVLDEDIDFSEFFEDGFKAGLDLIDIGDVHFYGEGFAALGNNFLDEFGKFFLVARGDGNFGPGFGERVRRVAADALRRTRDDSYFILQIKHLRLSSGGVGFCRGDAFHRGLQTLFVFDVQRGDRALDLPHDAVEHAARADFDEGVHTFVQQQAHRSFPAHGT